MAKIGDEEFVSECKKELTKNDYIWLHKRDDSIDIIKWLIVDYRIAIESKKFGIEGKTFNEAMNGWRDHCCFNIKIPADTLGDYYRPLKDFFAMLKEISERGDISQNKRQAFLNQLLDNGDLIREALNDPIKVFRDKCSYQLGGLNDDEINNIYSKLSKEAFKSSWSQYIKNVTQLVQNEQSAQLKNKLLKLWRDVAGNESPREWSKAHRTPIAVMVPQGHEDVAKNVFETVMGFSPNEKDVQTVIDYLEKRPQYFKTLNDEQLIEKNFRDKIIGADYGALLDDNNEVRDQLEREIKDANAWYPNLRVKEFVRKFAEQKYYTGEAHDKVAARVSRMPEEKAKEFLMALLEKNFEVGLAILREF